MLGTAIAAVEVAAIFVIGRCHHVEERSYRWIIHQRQIIPLLAVRLAERDRLGVAGPQQGAAGSVSV
jgi:hypothetical protein